MIKTRIVVLPRAPLERNLIMVRQVELEMMIGDLLREFLMMIEDLPRELLMKMMIWGARDKDPDVRTHFVNRRVGTS